MTKFTALDILEEAFDEGRFDRTQVRYALEDGAYLSKCGYTDADTEVIEEAHRLVSKTAEDVLKEAKEGLAADSENFGDDEIKTGTVICCKVEVAYVDYRGRLFDEISVATEPTDWKLAEDATAEEVQALIDRLVEDALKELEQDLHNFGIN